jgi:hypothetical protein
VYRHLPGFLGGYVYVKEIDSRTREFDFYALSMREFYHLARVIADPLNKVRFLYGEFHDDSPYVPTV